MAIITHLDLHFASDHLEDGPIMLAGILLDTRNFDGCLGIEVLTDLADPSHVLVVEHWESEAADQAYRDWRAGPGASPLGTVLAGPGVKTQFGLTSAT